MILHVFVVAGSPPIDVIWIHNDREIHSNDPIFRRVSEGNLHKLVIPEVLRNTSGEFVCEAYNDYGDTDSYCMLNVRGKPHECFLYTLTDCKKLKISYNHFSSIFRKRPPWLSPSEILDTDTFSSLHLSLIFYFLLIFL